MLQRREDADKAKEALDGVTLHDMQLTIGWGKAITLPAVPAWPPPGGLAAAREGGAAVPPPSSDHHHHHRGPGGRGDYHHGGRHKEYDDGPPPGARRGGGGGGAMSRWAGRAAHGATAAAVPWSLGQSGSEVEEMLLAPGASCRGSRVDV